MNNRPCVWTVRRLVNIASVGPVLFLAVIPGCEQNPFSDERFIEKQVPQDMVRVVEPMRLSESKAPSTTPADQAPLSPDEVSRRWPLTAQAETSLTIEDCRVLALADNLDLQVQLLDPTITRESITQEEARFESLFFATLDASKSDTPTSSTLTGSQSDSISTDLGVRVPLRTGGELTFSLPIDRFSTNNSFSTLNPAYTSDFSISLSQQLLRGAGVRANTHAIRIAHYQTGISEARTKLEVIRVLAAVDRVYWRLYAARRELEVRKQEYDLAYHQLERARRLVDAKVAAEVEVIRAEAGVAQRLESIIIADNTLRDAERDLKRLLNRPGLEMSTRTVVVPATEPNPVHYDISPDAMSDSALANRMEMLELELQLAQDSSAIDFEKNQALPLFALDYTYNINGLGPTYNDALDLMIDRSFEDHRVGLRAEVPIGNAAAESRVRSAVLSRLQRLASRDQREASIRQEVYNAVDQIEANWQRILAARQSAILAARNLEAEQRQFELGLRTTTDVLDAQTAFANARLAEIRALTEYQIAQVDLAFATGTLLGAAQVRWAPDEPDVSAPSPLIDGR